MKLISLSPLSPFRGLITPPPAYTLGTVLVHTLMIPTLDFLSTDTLPHPNPIYSPLFPTSTFSFPDVETSLFINMMKSATRMRS